jgi:hypothetical protein
MLLDGLLSSVEVELLAGVRGLMTQARTVMEGALAQAEEDKAQGLMELEEQRAEVEQERVSVAEERVRGVAEVEQRRAQGLAEVASERAALQREIEAVHKHAEAQTGRVVLNVGGHKFETSVQTLRRLPGTFFDAYFSGHDVMSTLADGSIFVDRDGEHFGHVLQCLRDGVLAAADQEPRELDVELLLWLQREFAFYYIEFDTEQQEGEVVLAVGGLDDHYQQLASVERYDTIRGAWEEAAPVTTARAYFGLCELYGELYATG